jgi:hypothetical protein
MLRQGVLPKQLLLLPQQLSRQEQMEENSLKLHGKGKILGMLRLALIPAPCPSSRKNGASWGPHSPGLARRSA